MRMTGERVSAMLFVPYRSSQIFHTMNGRHDLALFRDLLDLLYQTSSEESSLPLAQLFLVSTRDVVSSPTVGCHRIVAIYSFSCCLNRLAAGRSRARLVHNNEI
eukprot:scaffold647974_cov41-Prasinocladus_malaysianus.AAC.2